MPRPAVYIETFGCQMNELDSELVVGQLRALGYTLTADPEQASVILYNTCSVREHAEQKVWSRLGELKQRKERSPELVVGVLGCMAERDAHSLIRRMPVVDVLCGPGELDKLPTLIDNAARTRAALLDNAAPGDEPHLHSAAQVALQGSTSRRSATLAAAEDTLELLDLSRSISPTDESLSRRRTAYVRVTRGCNKFCTYCVVPFTRGAEVHRPPEHIVDECRRLADAGVIEITLLGQTVNHYRFEHGAAVTVGGVVQPQKGRSYQGGHRRDPFRGENTTTFADLLARIHESVPSVQRLRFVTSYPRDFGDDVLEVIRDHPRICRYLHVPAQSGSDRILRLMNRGYTVAEYTEFLARARSFLHQPEKGRPLMLSGDFIVGFPGETEEDFEQTRALIRHARYKNAFIFKYSPRPGTVAIEKLTDDVPEDVKRRRNNELLAIQGAIGEEIGRELVGGVFPILVEGMSARETKRRKREAASSVTALTVRGAAYTANGIPDTPDARDDRASIQLTGRTDSDQIVHFDVTGHALAESLIGQIVPVRIDRSSALACLGSLVPSS